MIMMDVMHHLYFFDMVMDMEDDKVAEIFVGMVADLELDNVVDKVADMEVDKVSGMVICVGRKV